MSGPPAELVVSAAHAAVQQTVARWLVHHVRTPLQTVALMSSLLAAARADDDAAEWLSLLEAGARDIAQTIAQLELLLRPLPWPGEPAPVPLAGVIETVARLHATRSGAAPLEVDAEAAGRLPAARGVEPHLVHAVLWLVIAARHRTGEPAAPLRIAAAEAADGMLELWMEGDPFGPDDPAADWQAVRLLLERSGGELRPAGDRGPVLRLAPWR